MTPLIAPSILSADFSALGDDVAALEAAGADWIHVDVMDGHFVPNLTIGPPVVAALKKNTKCPLDVHLMMSRPENFLEVFVDAGADWLTVHAEACVHLDRTLSAIRDLGVKAGVALNPATPPETVSWLGDLVDLVLVMTVNPGFGGQRFRPSQLEKIRWLRAYLGEDIHLAVDGGVTPETAADCRAAGANVLVAGSAVFENRAFRDNMERLRHSGEEKA